MASLVFQRASWRLQISRAHRIFSVSFTTALPGRSRLPRSITAPHHDPSHSPSSDVPTLVLGSAAASRLRHSEARRHFSNTRIHRAQQVATATSSSTRNTPASSSQPPPSGDSLSQNTKDFSEGLNDGNIRQSEPQNGVVDWTQSFQGLSSEAFSPEAAKILLAPLELEDIEVKPDGLLYLPEIKYRRILNQAFGPGGWGLAPRGETIITAKSVTREYALVALGRLVSIARGEQDYFTPEHIPTAVEGCKSIALRRCCKDLGVASELWDPRFIRKFMTEQVKEVFVEHTSTRSKRKIYLRKGEKPRYPYKELK